MIETFGPEFLIFGQPFGRLLHWPDIEGALNRPPALAALDQPGTQENIKVLHDGRQCHIERRGELADRQALLAAQPRKHSPARCIRQRGENAIEVSLRKLNHMVKCYGKRAWPSRLQQCLFPAPAD